MIDLQAIKDYYTNLLIIQYHDKPKAKATVELFVKELLCDGVMFDIQQGFTIDNAVGKQLDILGKYIDLDRFYKGQNFDFANNFFGFTDYNSTDNGQEGFTTYADYETKVGQFLSNDQVASNNQSLGDDDYRFLLKLKIICNNMNYSQYSIDKLLNDKFGNDLILSTLNDFKITYFASETIYGIINVMLQKDLFPKPMGVLILGIITATNNVFSFISYDEDLTIVSNDNLRQGFTTYTDYDNSQGELLTFDKILKNA